MSWEVRATDVELPAEARKPIAEILHTDPEHVGTDSTRRARAS